MTSVNLAGFGNFERGDCIQSVFGTVFDRVDALRQEREDSGKSEPSRVDLAFTAGL